MASTTLYDKIWQAHVVREYADGDSLLYVDRHLVQEVSSPQAFATLNAAGRKVRRPNAHLAVPDHAVSTDGSRADLAAGLAGRQVARLAENCARHGIEYISPDDPRHGIVHVIGPQLGFTLPGTVLVCGDSHTSTHGAFGCIAFGIGASECATALCTQTLRQRRQKTMRVNLHGALRAGVSVKDIALALMVRLGADGGVGYAIEYAGETISTLSMSARMTLCNMSIEAGSRVGLIAVDDTTIDYMKERPFAPSGALWDAAKSHWRTLHSDQGAVFDREVDLNVSALEQHISWGTSPEQSAPVSGIIPDPAHEPDPGRRQRLEKSLAYMDLKPGTKLTDIAIDRVFIGSCTNGRLEDLRAAATVVRGRHIAPKVSALVVPGSAATRAEAEAEGLDQIFLKAGFEWRQAGCSMCVAMNDDRLKPGERCASTSNRNFEGRQGAGGRTHLMSPQLAALSALTGRLGCERSGL